MVPDPRFPVLGPRGSHPSRGPSPVGAPSGWRTLGGHGLVFPGTWVSVYDAPPSFPSHPTPLPYFVLIFAILDAIFCRLDTTTLGAPPRPRPTSIRDVSGPSSGVEEGLCPPTSSRTGSDSSKSPEGSREEDPTAEATWPRTHLHQDTVFPRSRKLILDPK